MPSFLQGFLRGLASPAEVFSPPEISVPRRSAEEAMRHDLEKIGGDFRSAIAHEYADDAGR
jgi:hypothetical protein